MEIVIALRANNEWRTTAVSIRLCLRTPEADERRPAQSANGEIGEGPLLPDNNLQFHSYDSVSINVDPNTFALQSTHTKSGCVCSFWKTTP